MIYFMCIYAFSLGSYPGQRKKIRVEMKPYLEHDDSDSDSSEIGNSLHRDIQRMRYQGKCIRMCAMKYACF